MTSQRRGFVKEGFGFREVNAELDFIHQVLNALNYPIPEKVIKNYVASVADRRISCMRAGITITLPSLGEDDDGWLIFIQDRSGDATASPITVLPPKGVLIRGATSATISTDYGSQSLQWDFGENQFF